MGGGGGQESGGMAGHDWKSRQVFHFRNRTEEFYYNGASNDRSVLSQSLIFLCSIAGVSHFWRTFQFYAVLVLYVFSHCLLCLFFLVHAYKL